MLKLSLYILKFRAGFYILSIIDIFFGTNIYNRENIVLPTTYNTYATCNPHYASLMTLSRNDHIIEYEADLFLVYIANRMYVYTTITVYTKSTFIEIYTIHCIVYTVHCIQCTVYSVHCIV